MKYQLIPTTFFIATGAGEKWYHQEAKDAYEIICSEIPDWIGLILHRGQTPEKRPTDWWTISCKETGASFLKDAIAPVFEPEFLIVGTLATVRTWKKAEYQKRFNKFRDLLKELEYVGKKRLSEADKHRKQGICLN